MDVSASCLLVFFRLACELFLLYCLIVLLYGGALIVCFAVWLLRVVILSVVGVVVVVACLCLGLLSVRFGCLLAYWFVIVCLGFSFTVVGCENVLLGGGYWWCLRVVLLCVLWVSCGGFRLVWDWFLFRLVWVYVYWFVVAGLCLLVCVGLGDALFGCFDFGGCVCGLYALNGLWVCIACCGFGFYCCVDTVGLVVNDCYWGSFIVFPVLLLLWLLCCFGCFAVGWLLASIFGCAWLCGDLFGFDGLLL